MYGRCGGARWCTLDPGRPQLLPTWLGLQGYNLQRGLAQLLRGLSRSILAPPSGLQVVITMNMCGNRTGCSPHQTPCRKSR